MRDAVMGALRVLGPLRVMGMVLLSCCVQGAWTDPMAFVDAPVLSIRENREETSVPFTLTSENVMLVEGRLNDGEPMKLMVHTAETDLTLTEDYVRSHDDRIHWDGKVDVQAWGGHAEQRSSKNNKLLLGTLSRENVTVWEDKHSGPGSDGKFGLDCLSSNVIELDFANAKIVLHETVPERDCLEIPARFDEEKCMVPVRFRIESEEHEHHFLLHSGYAGGLLFDDAFVARVPVGNAVANTVESKLTDALGNTLRVTKGELSGATIGDQTLDHLPAGFFAGSIGSQKISVLGMAVIQRVHWIIDRKNQRLYVVRDRGSE